MRESKGQWKIDFRNEQYCIVNECFNDSEIVAWICNSMCGLNHIRNANLICNAPKLAERLEKLVISVKSHPDYILGKNQEFIDLVDLSEEALNLALHQNGNT